MNEAARMNRLSTLDQINYPKFRGRIIELYLHAFTSGEYAQYIDPRTAGSTLDTLVRNGWGNMLFVGDRLAGVSMAMTLLHDVDFPADALPAIPPERTLYISEVMVHADFRGRGIARQMVTALLEGAGDRFSDAVIRVWERNEPALLLYNKLGFKPVATIRQTKLEAPGRPFEMTKIYLHRRICSSDV